MAKNKNKPKKNKKQKKKEAKMGWWEKTKKTFGTTSWNKTKPTVGKNKDTLSIALFKQSTLDKIAEDCLPKAGGAEFQVHYRGIQILIKKPESNKRIVFTIPTVFFNMPQTVTSGSVDYTLDDVAEASNQVKPISDAMVSKIIEAFPVAYFEQQGFEVSARELEMGSMHRHPGNFGFSTIDLDNQVEKPGIIFRRLECEDLIQVDSVMYIPNGTVKLVTTETRNITVKPTEDGGIEGQYLETPTMHYIIQDVEVFDDFGDFFGEEEAAQTKKITFKYGKSWFDKDYPEIEEILKIFVGNLDYDPMIIVDPGLIKTYTYQRKTYGGANTYTRKNNYHYYNDYGYAYDDDGFDDLGYATPKGIPAPGTQEAEATKTPEQKRILERPTWRPTQTLSLLRTRKVDLKQYPEIDGKGSDQDMLAIVQALKDKNYLDQDIRKFLTDTGYPAHEAMIMYYNNLEEEIVEVTDDETLLPDETSGMAQEASSNIQLLLKTAKDEDDLYDTIDILFDSDIDEDEVKNQLDEAGYNPEVVMKAYWASQKQTEE